MKQIFLIFSGLLLLLADVFCQCTNNNVFYSNLTPASKGTTATSSCIFGGEYATVNVIAGEIYSFSTCNTDPFVGGFDSQITLYNGASSIALGYDDDYCAPFSKIIWTATFTGVLRVVVDEYNCQTGSDCFNLDVTWEDPVCNVASLTSICPTISGNFQLGITGTDAVITDPVNNWDCMAGAPDAHFYNVEIATSGNLNMTLTGSVDDIDFVLWGPFSSNADAISHCGFWGTGGANGSVIDCGYTTSAVEFPDVSAAVAGQVYVLVVSNYAGVPQTISLTQTGGTGTAAQCVVFPTVATTAQSGVTAISATLGGNVTSDGGATVTERGIVWSTTSTPTVLSNKVQNGSGTGLFSQTVSGLPSGTLIYVRAYAVNSQGVSYGNEISFTTSSATSKYVDITASGANNGTSWANAYTNLQSALAGAISGDTIFVAAGTYKPDGASPGNRNLSFNMKTGVVLMGGFPSGGGILASRNWVTNPTILSGDIGTVGVNTDNSYHVVRCASQQGELNGFIIEKGRADGAAPDNDGGGVFITAGYLTSKFCTYRNNFASDQGGGSYHDAGGNPQYRQCKFESNTAAFGGGSFLFASTIVANCIYLNNAATTNGGGVYAVVNINMYNNTFRGNSAVTSGNAIYYQSGGSNRLFNSIVWGNTGSATHIAGAGSISLEYCFVQGGCPGGGATCNAVTNVDPLYADAVGRLSSTSPAIDAGDISGPDFNNNTLTVDYDNNNRNFDAIPGGGTRDLGAFESQILNLTKYYVDHTATGSNDGSSWANAFTSFQSAVAIADNGDDVFVAAGTHKPTTGVSTRGKTFTLKEGVRYYGGFPAGGGTMAQRNFSANRTILSGDIGTVNDSTDNCYVVVIANNLTNATLMSGFTVERGNADSSGYHIYSRSGGIHLGGTGSMSLDSVTLRNNFGGSGAGIHAEQPTNWLVRGCTIENNSNGAGIYVGGNASGSFLNSTFTNNVGFNGGAILFNVLSATFTLTNCNFTNNTGTYSGGGGAISVGAAALTFTNCTFTNNRSAGSGGALHKFYSTINTFTNCTFTGNTCTTIGSGGGALYGQGGFNLYRCTFSGNRTLGTSGHGGAIYNNGTPSIIENCLFWGNNTVSGIGGAIYNNTGGTLNIRNSTFAKNNAGAYTQGGGINNNSNANANITNSIFWGNIANGVDVASNTEIGHGSGTLNVTNTIWQGNTAGGTIFNLEPFFTNITTGDLTLTACSNAIDAGTATGAPAVDILGNPRPINGDGLGGLEFDLGAYEVQVPVNNPGINVQGNNITILDGDITPNTGDHSDFDAMVVCGGTFVRTFTIQNVGLGPLTISSVNITGAHASDFSITSPPANLVAANGSTTFDVTFDPSAGGLRTATITINNSDCNEAVYDFAIQGTDNISFVPPTVICQNVILNLDALGNATLLPTQVDNGSADFCGIASMGLSRTAFSCNDANAGNIFWTGSGNINKSKNDGSSTANLITSGSGLFTISLVPELGYIYVANFSASKIQRMNFAGGGLTDILIGVQPFGIDVDPIGGKIYWADPNANTISRCNLDGTGTQIIVSGAGNTDYSRTIKIDQVNNKLYFTDANLGTVKRCNLDGTGLQTLVTGQGNIVGLDLDVANNKMYFSSYSFNQVKRANLDGSGLTVLFNTGSIPLGVSLDLVAGKIYLANGTGNNTIQKANIDGTGLTTILSGLPTPYDIAVFPEIKVTLTVTDNTNISATCTSLVTVKDVTPPVAIAQNITVQLNSSGIATITGAQINNGSNDACGILSLSASPNSFTCANTGANNVTLTVKDVNGNTSTANAVVTVQDNIAPAITCPSNISVNAGAGLCGAVVTYTAPVGTDNCSGATTIQIAGLASGATFPVGTTTNTFRVTDAAGLQTACSFTVTVIDNIAPSITCPSNISVNASAGLCSAVVTYTAPVGTDNCAGATTTQIAGLASGATFPMGTTMNTFRVTDAAGLTTNCSFTVTVTDNQPPAIVCPSNISVNAGAGLCSAVVTYTAPVGTDNCSGATTTQIAGLASGATFPVGTTTNTFRVTDAAGLTTNCSFTVTVTDNQAPVIICPANIAVNTTIGLCGAVVTYTTPVGTDNCSGTTTVQTAGLSSGATFPLGVTTNTFRVTDAAGNQTFCSFTVTVTDITPPSAVAQNIIVQLNGSGTASITGAQINNGSSDACGINSLSVLPSGFNCSNVGANVVILTVTDANGNISTANATVTVQDITPPVAIAQNITVQLDASGNATITGAMVNNGSNDACGIASLSVFPSSFTCANVGPNNVMLTVTDVNGNISTSNAVITVNPIIFAPVIANPMNIAINPGQYITYTGSTAVGTIRWYNAGNVLVGTGNTFVTPVLTSGTTYTAKASVSTCESSGTLLTVTLKPASTFGGRKAN